MQSQFQACSHTIQIPAVQHGHPSQTAACTHPTPLPLAPTCPDRALSLHCCPPQIDAVVGDRLPTVADMRALRFTTRVINESMRLYPQPPVLLRRALQDDAFDAYKVGWGGACARPGGEGAMQQPRNVLQGQGGRAE